MDRSERNYSTSVVGGNSLWRGLRRFSTSSVTNTITTNIGLTVPYTVMHMEYCAGTVLSNSFQMPRPWFPATLFPICTHRARKIAENNNNGLYNRLKKTFLSTRIIYNFSHGRIRLSNFIARNNFIILLSTKRRVE